RYPLRILTPDVLAQLETSQLPLRSYLSLALPTEETWLRYNDSVLFGTLERFAEQFPPSALSQLALQVSNQSSGKITESKAHELVRYMGNQHRTVYELNRDQYTDAVFPVVALDYGSPLLEA